MALKFSVGCELNYTIVEPTTLILNVDAMQGERQQVLGDSFEVTPAARADRHQAIGTENLYRRLALLDGDYCIRYRAQVALTPRHDEPGSIVEIPIADQPLAVLPYLYPSRYCQSDRLARFAWRQFGNAGRGHERVTTICNWIHENVDYLAGTSNSATSAYDTFSLRAGVCRDFAHLGITFCRALGIPARFVSAYGWQLMPQDFHAVFEAYLGGRWYLFDATRLSPLDGLVRIGVGRDAADTAFATFYGNVIQGPVKVWIDPLEPADVWRPWTTMAVSVAAD